MLIPMRDGKKIFLQYWNSNKKDTIVYLHGGPGIGCWDFLYSAQLLSEYYNVIIFDQRGVLRSDKLTSEDNFKSEDIIDDIEDIRRYFKLEHIVLIGHSYGGMLILRYAEKYHTYISRLIYVCPSFSMLMSERNIFRIAKNYISLDNKKLINDIDDAIAENSFEKYFSVFITIPAEIRAKIYVEPQAPDDVAEVIDNQNIKDEEWENGGLHQQIIFSEPYINKNYLPELTGIHIPSVLILGEHDPVCCEEQIDGFRKNAYEAKVAIIKEAGHMPYRYKPVEFVDCVRKYI